MTPTPNPARPKTDVGGQKAQTPPTPLEKVARALAERFADCCGCYSDRCCCHGVEVLECKMHVTVDELAKIALGALQTPSGPMLDAGAQSFGVGNSYIGSGSELLNGQPSKCWRAMIDAALGEEG